MGQFKQKPSVNQGSDTGVIGLRQKKTKKLHVFFG